jgi:RNA polymerase sigma factor (TIGR02999 family)
MPIEPRDLTDSLTAHVGGNARAGEELLPVVYGELRALAGAYMKTERPDHSLTPTAVVHEAYIRLIDNDRIDWQGKTHFLAMAAVQMRRVLVDHARARGAEKRGGDRVRITLDSGVALIPGEAIDLLALNEALEKLERLSPRQASVVGLRFFGGLSVKEAAFQLDISERTVKEDWRFARVWLRRELE